MATGFRNRSLDLYLSKSLGPLIVWLYVGHVLLTIFFYPAYGRQRMSWPIWIVPPITKISCSLRPNLPKNKHFLRCNFTPFISKSIQIWDHFFPLSFPKNSESESENFGHLTLGSGGKKTFKRYYKSEQTDGRTNTRTDILTYRKNPTRGPIFWKKEKN